MANYARMYEAEVLSEVVSAEDYSLRNCRDVSPEIFFPATPVKTESLVEDIVYANYFCGSCILKAECLKVAIDNHEQDGIWGGQYFGRGKGGRLKLDIKVHEILD